MLPPAPPPVLEPQARLEVVRPGQQQPGDRRERGRDGHGHWLPRLRELKRVLSMVVAGAAWPRPGMGYRHHMETLAEDLLLLAVRPNGKLGAAPKLRFGMSGYELVRLAAARRGGI